MCFLSNHNALSIHICMIRKIFDILSFFIKRQQPNLKQYLFKISIGRGQLAQVVESGANNAKVVSSMLTQATKPGSSTVNAFCQLCHLYLAPFWMIIFLAAVTERRFLGKKRTIVLKTDEEIFRWNHALVFFKTYTTYNFSSHFYSSITLPCSRTPTWSDTWIGHLVLPRIFVVSALMASLQ